MLNAITNFFATPDDQDPSFMRVARNIMILRLNRDPGDHWRGSVDRESQYAVVYHLCIGCRQPDRIRCLVAGYAGPSYDDQGSGPDCFYSDHHSGLSGQEHDPRHINSRLSSYHHSGGFSTRQTSADHYSSADGGGNCHSWHFGLLRPQREPLKEKAPDPMTF